MKRAALVLAVLALVLLLVACEGEDGECRELRERWGNEDLSCEELKDIKDLTDTLWEEQ